MDMSKKVLGVLAAVVIAIPLNLLGLAYAVGWADPLAWWARDEPVAVDPNPCDPALPYSDRRIPGCATGPLGAEPMRQLAGATSNDAALCSALAGMRSTGTDASVDLWLAVTADDAVLAALDDLFYSAAEASDVAEIGRLDALLLGRCAVLGLG